MSKGSIVVIDRNRVEWSNVIMKRGTGRTSCKRWMKSTISMCLMLMRSTVTCTNNIMVSLNSYTTSWTIKITFQWTIWTTKCIKGRWRGHRIIWEMRSWTSYLFRDIGSIGNISRRSFRKVCITRRWGMLLCIRIFRVIIMINRKVTVICHFRNRG